MSVRVTSGGGFIGSNVVDRFLQLGASVIAYDNFSPASANSFLTRLAMRSSSSRKRTSSMLSAGGRPWLEPTDADRLELKATVANDKTGQQ